MAKAKTDLVIVESPAKARTIEKYLGGNYKVVASMGHLRDLPKSKLGVDIEHGFEPEYIPVKGREDVINDLKKRYIRSAHKKIALLDHTKFQRKGFYKTCNFTDMDLLITDSKTPADIIDKIRRGGTPVEVVEI